MVSGKNKNRVIELAYGEGGKLTRKLIRELFLKYFSNEYLNLLDDGAVLKNFDCDIVISTDSFIVTPLFFPGGNIGELAVNGTANDVAMMGAEPLFISLSFIIEEGFPIDDLEKIVRAISESTKKNNIKVVTGDTKVVPRGKADGIYINTTGLGKKIFELSCDFKPGDEIVVSGTLGDHSIAVLIARGQFGFKSDLKSDTCFLWNDVKNICNSVKGVKFLRDITRGGLAENLNDIIAGDSFNGNFGIEIEEEKIPVKKEVTAVCELLGYDVLYLANEGKFFIVVDEGKGEDVVKIMKKGKFCKDASVIGKITDRFPGIVSLKTAIGTERVIDSRSSIQLPRIC